MFICQKNLKYSNIDLDKYCKDQDIEVCVLKIKSTFFNVCIMAVYRAPIGNFNLFLHRLDDIIKTLYKGDLQPIVCGDINIDHLTDNDINRQLDAVLLTYNLSTTEYFPTRSQGYSNTAIDNIFMDTYKFINFTLSPLHNGLSDHDAQVLKIISVNLQLQKHHFYTIRNIFICKTLTSVIKEAKIYVTRIINSTNKTKTTWNIIKAETNRLIGPTTTTINNNQNSVESSNKYFLSITESILKDC